MKVTVIISKEASEFIRQQPTKARQKIYFTIFKVEEGVRDIEIFKKLGDSEIWEFRTLYEGKCFRLFAFWDKNRGAYVITTHGIVKKTQKTPKKEIEKAERIRQAYFDKQKQKENGKQKS